MRVNELRCKEVVNVTDGARLGEEIYIRWCDIQKIGKDAVLVCIDPPNQNSQKNGFFSSLFK